MKNSILVFIIGLLLGAILASGAFLIYSKSSSNDNNGFPNNQMGGPPDMNGTSGGTPPEKPNGDNETFNEQTND